MGAEHVTDGPIIISLDIGCRLVIGHSPDAFLMPTRWIVYSPFSGCSNIDGAQRAGAPANITGDIKRAAHLFDPQSGRDIGKGVSDRRSLQTP